MKHGQVAAVEYLTQTNDDARIVEAWELFEARGRSRGAEGFEVWDGAHFVYRYPDRPLNATDAS
jgi:hypothetical protein